MGPQFEGYCLGCAQSIIRQNYENSIFDKHMCNPHVKQLYLSYLTETGIRLTNYNLEVLQLVDKFEAAGNYGMALQKLSFYKPYFPRQNTTTIMNYEKRISQLQIEKLKLCGRYEDAAILYEKIGMYKEAGDTRRLERTIKNVNVDVNKLIEELKNGGLGHQYKCPNCGAMIQFSESDAGKIRNCSYCGASIDPEAMMKILREVMR
jgi:hypothetical protein